MSPGAAVVDTSGMRTCPECPDRAFLAEETLQTHVETRHAGTELARQFTTKQRKTAAKKGQAQKDGSYPIKNQADLKNAIQAYGRSKNKAATKAHIIRRARALGLTKLLPSGWGSDSAKESGMNDYKLYDGTVIRDSRGRLVKPCHDHAEAVMELRRLTVGSDADQAALALYPVECWDPECARGFVGPRAFDNMVEHAEAVHTFSDIERLVREAVREKYYVRGDYKANPVVPSTWAWVDDLATDWVVFTVEKDGDSTLFKASYSITDDAVTLGEAKKVKRRTVYDEIKED